MRVIFVIIVGLVGRDAMTVKSIVVTTVCRNLVGLSVEDVIRNSAMIATRRRQAWTQYESAKAVTSTPVVNVWFQ